MAAQDRDGTDLVAIGSKALYLPLICGLAAPVLPALAAGGGAGAGGAGHQRAINSGLSAGEAGPPGSPNNPRPAPKPQEGIKGSPRGQGTPPTQ